MICSVDNCGEPVKARVWCSKHYQRWKNHGSPLAAQFERAPQGAIDAFLKKAVRHTGDACLTWPFARAGKGYGKVGKDYAHRVVCAAVHGPAPTANHEVAHSCGRGYDACVSPKHLRWATRSENQADRIIHGTDFRGENSPSAKLKTEEIQTIRARYAAGGISQRALGAEFGITQSYVSELVLKKKWAHLV